MKGLIYYRINQDDIANVGVLKKCLAQVEAFQALGVSVDLIILSNKGILLNNQLIHSFTKPTLSKSPAKYWFYFFNLLPLIAQKLNIRHYDFIYFRYALAHPALIRFLATVKNQNPGLKIIAELPTYPYEKEKKSIIDRLSLLMDQHYRKKLSTYLDKITHYGLEPEIFDIPTIPISNGVSINKIPVSNSQPQKKELRLIAMANWSNWHGLDRLIEGLKNYYTLTKPEILVTLKIIGHGKAIPQYKALVQKYSLQKIVYFFPPKIDKELGDHFDQADLGIGTLGIHRKDIAIDSSLKHREYCARGIPFLFASKDIDFPDSLFFVLKSPPTNQPIEINSLIFFWENFVKEREIRKKEIREYAKNQLDWKKRVKKVMNFVKK